MPKFEVLIRQCAPWMFGVLLSQSRIFLLCAGKFSNVVSRHLRPLWRVDSQREVGSQIVRNQSRTTRHKQKIGKRYILLPEARSLFPFCI